MEADVIRIMDTKCLPRSDADEEVENCAVEGLRRRLRSMFVIVLSSKRKEAS